MASRRAGRVGVLDAAQQWLRGRVRHPRYRHVFHGDVNMATRPPRASGFHHRFQGHNPSTARVRRDPATGNEIITKTGVDGTYRARVDVRGPDGNWYAKVPASSFFPDDWTPQRVDAAIRNAFANRQPHAEPHKWAGAADGLAIEGIYNSQRTHWHSAWPVV